MRALAHPVPRMVLLGALLFPAPTAAIAPADGPVWVAATALAAAAAIAGIPLPGVRTMESLSPEPIYSASSS